MDENESRTRDVAARSTPQVVVATSSELASSVARSRITAIDVMRGLVIVLMVLDHTRDFVGSQVIEPTDVVRTTPLLFFTRWVTHFCAPTFVFLAGTSAWLMSTKLPRRELQRFLLTRGLWLVFLELTVVRFAWTFDLTYRGGLILQVIWAIGVSMGVLAALTWLPDRVVLVVGVVMVASHNLLDGITPDMVGSWAPLWSLLHVQGRIGPGYVAYPLVPWIGVMALGYGAGRLFELDAARRRTWLYGLGLTSLLVFVLLRVRNGYGDPAPWSAQTSDVRTALSFLNVSKYPPSLDYVLLTLGPMLCLLAALERADGRAARMLRTVGQVPLFAYVLHLLLAHGLAGVLGMLSGRGTQIFRQVFYELPEDWGLDLRGVYLTWALVLVLLYPACRWFAAKKRARGAWWLAYL